MVEDDQAFHPDYLVSARNLLHYIALRRHDLRSLQVRLAQLGLSSLGRSEAHVSASVEAVLHVLERLAGPQGSCSQVDAPAPEFAEGPHLLLRHTETLLGPEPGDRHVRIMVTMPSEAANDYKLVHDLLAQGMDCMRINCAHDNPAVWRRMIEHLRRAEGALRRSCRIAMDLAGPKLRTGPVMPGPAVLHIRPKRDAFGRVVTPARVWLYDEASGVEPPTQADAALPVAGEWLAGMAKGDRLRLQDTAGRERQLEIIEAEPHGVWAQCAHSTYVASGTALEHLSLQSGAALRFDGAVGSLVPAAGFLTLRQGDLLLITPDQRPGEPATLDSFGKVLGPARIGCTLPEVFAHVRPADLIWLDDGKIGGIVQRVDASGLLVRVLHARARGEKLRGDKGINLPDTDLHLSALTVKDRDDLRFAVDHADIVGLSFVNSDADVRELIKEIEKAGSRRPGIILKIETRRGFENLPGMLLEAMRTLACGVMIARGDLAVECGYERMAEVQEEILWICEAAHVPVIWATQVLETLAKDGIPSRAEITDAAMGHRAECVMLNKGPNIIQAVKSLDDILRRMQTHQDKKRPMMRDLQLARAFHPAV